MRGRDLKDEKIDICAIPEFQMSFIFPC